MSERLIRTLEEQIAAIHANQLRSEDRAAASARWLLATLVALNGGAIVSLLSADRLAQVEPAPLLFLSGIISALLSGFTGHLYSEHQAVTWMQIRLHMTKQPPDIAAAEKAVSARKTRLILSILEILALVLAIALFVAGAAVAGRALA